MTTPRSATARARRPTATSSSESEVYPPASDFFPARKTLGALARSAEGCRACKLYRRATRVVFGEGPRRAELLLVGEQPGDREDLSGRPFVGPAGALLDRVLADVGIDRDAVYVTNVVKHFHWKEGRGKRRIHERPGLVEVSACLPWFRAELELLRPKVVVCLGATAAQAILGRQFRVTRDRGEPIVQEVAAKVSAWVLATHHPSAVLRARDEARARLRGELADDLERAGALLRSRAAGAA